jgi:hypothetical protein
LTVRPGLPYLRLRLSAAARRHVRASPTKVTLKSTLTDSSGRSRLLTQMISILK